MFKVNNKGGVYISHHVLVFLLLTFNMQLTAGLRRSEYIQDIFWTYLYVHCTSCVQGDGVSSEFLFNVI